MNSDSNQIYKNNQVQNFPKNDQQNQIPNQLENASGLDHIKTLFNVPVNIYKKNGDEKQVLNKVEQNLSFIYSNDLSEQWLIEPDVQSDGLLILQSVKDRVQHKGLTIKPQNDNRYELRWSQNGEQISISDVVISKHSLKEDQFQKTQFSMIELMNMSDNEENQLIQQDLPASKTEQINVELKSLDSFIQDIRDVNPPVVPYVYHDFWYKVVVIQKDDKLLTVTGKIEFIHSLEFCKQSQWIIYPKDQNLVARSVYDQKTEYKFQTEQVIKKSYNFWQLSAETIKIVDAKLSSDLENLNFKQIVEQEQYVQTQRKIIPFELEGQVIQICQFENNKFATVHRRNTKYEYKPCQKHKIEVRKPCLCCQEESYNCNLCGLCRSCEKSCALRQQILEKQNYKDQKEDGIWINLWCFEDMAYCYDSFGLSSVVAPDDSNILLEGNGLFYFKKTEQIQIINLITKEVIASFDNSNEIYKLLDDKLKKPDIVTELKSYDQPVNELVMMSNNKILKVGDSKDSIFIDLLLATKIATLPGVLIKQTTTQIYLWSDRDLFVYPYRDSQIDSYSKKYEFLCNQKFGEYTSKRAQIKLCDSDEIQFYAKVGSQWQFYTLQFDNSRVIINECLSNFDKQKSVVLNKNLCYKYDFINTKQVNGLDQIEIELGDDLLFSNNKRLPIYEVLNTFVVSDKPNILIFYADDKRQTHYCIIECQKDKNKKTIKWEPPRAIQNYFVGEDKIIYKSDYSNEIIVQSLFNLQDKHSFLLDECFMKIGKHMAPNVYEPLVLTKESETFRCKSGFYLEDIFQFRLSKNEEFEFHAGQITDLILLHDYLIVQLESNLVYIDRTKPKIELVSKNKFPKQKLVLSNEVIYYFEIDQTNSQIKQISAGENTLKNEKYCDLPVKQIISIQLGLQDELFVLTHNFKVFEIENGVVVKNFSIPNEMTESVLVLNQNYLLDFDNLINLSNKKKRQLDLPLGNQKIILVENIFQEHLFVTSNQTEGSFILQQHCCSRSIGLHSRFKNKKEKIKIFSTESCLIKYKEIGDSKTIYFYDKNSFKQIGSSTLPETTTEVQVIGQLLLREDSEITESFKAKQNVVSNGWSCIKIYKNQQSLEFDFYPEYDQLLKDSFDISQQYKQIEFLFPSFDIHNHQLFCVMRISVNGETIVKIKNLNIYVIDWHQDNLIMTEKFIAPVFRNVVKYISLIDIPEIDKNEIEMKQKNTFKQIDLDYAAINISKAKENDLNLIQKWNKPKQNFICIQHKPVCILWDLESNTEISQIRYNNQLQEPCNYVDTGFNTLRDQHYLIQNCVFQTYSVANLMELRQIYGSLDKQYFDEETIFAIYGNQTFFNFIWDINQTSDKGNSQRWFEDRLIQVFDWLKQIILDQNIVNKQQQNQMDNIFIRRLFYLLNNTIMPFESQEQIRFEIKEGRPNLLQWAILHRSVILEPLLNLLSYSSEFKFDDVVGTYFLFEEIDQIKSSALQKLIQTNLTVRNSFLTTKILVPWNDQDNFITLPMSNSFKSKNQIENSIKLFQEQQHILTWFVKLLNKKMSSTLLEKIRNKKMRSLNVDVRIIDITWLQNENYSRLFQYLVEEVDPDDRLYFQRNIVQYLVDYESRNILYQLLPILTTNFIFTVLNLIYLNKFIFIKEISNQAICIGSFIIITATLMTFVEYFQIYTQKTRYINFWNIVQLSVYILSITVVIQHLLGRWEQATLLQVASVTTFLLWLTVFYWLRVLPQFSYYVKMISQAVEDIRYFLLMLLIIIIAFSNANFILLQIGSEQNDISTLYLSTLLRQYNIAFTIGESFTPSDENDTPTSLIMDLLSVASTLVTTTVFLNIFIGIIGTTLSKVSEINHFVTLREQVQLYHDYEKIIQLYSKTHWFEGKKYIYVFTPSIDEDQLDNSAEKVQAILESCNQQEQIVNELKMELNNVQNTISEIQKQISENQQQVSENQKQMKYLVESMKNEIVESMRTSLVEIHKKN